LPVLPARWREQSETMKISLNFATRPYVDIRVVLKFLRITMGVLAVIAICLAFGLRALHQQAEEARNRNHSLDSQIARVTKERQGYQEVMHRPENAQLIQRIAEINRLFDEKAFSWTLAMEDLETVLPAGVQASALEPVRAKDGSITLHLRVVGPRDRAVDLVRNLERSRRFLLPRIVGENAESSGGPADKLEPVSASSHVDFDLLADFNPASLLASGRTEKKPHQSAEKTEQLAAARPEGKAASHVNEKLARAARQTTTLSTLASPRASAQTARPPIANQVLLSRLNSTHKPDPGPSSAAGGSR
jgi:type IV pilus assembly protein PilN